MAVSLSNACDSITRTKAISAASASNFSLIISAPGFSKHPARFSGPHCPFSRPHENGDLLQWESTIRCRQTRHAARQPRTAGRGETPRAESESAAIRKSCGLLRPLATSCGNLQNVSRYPYVMCPRASQQPVYTPSFGLRRLPFCATRRPFGPDSAQGLDFAGFRLSECGRYTYRPVRNRYPGFSATPRHRGGGGAHSRIQPSAGTRSL